MSANSSKTPQSNNQIVMVVELGVEIKGNSGSSQLNQEQFPLRRST